MQDVLLKHVYLHDVEIDYFQYRCNEYGTWEPDIQVPVCSKPTPRPTKSRKYSYPINIL